VSCPGPVEVSWFASGPPGFTSWVCMAGCVTCGRVFRATMARMTGSDDTWADLCDRLEQTVLGELHTFDLGKESG
jgi:hypothetical protein